MDPLLCAAIAALGALELDRCLSAREVDVLRDIIESDTYPLVCRRYVLGRFSFWRALLDSVTVDDANLLTAAVAQRRRASSIRVNGGTGRPTTSLPSSIGQSRYRLLPGAPGALLPEDDVAAPLLLGLVFKQPWQPALEAYLSNGFLPASSTWLAVGQTDASRLAVLNRSVELLVDDLRKVSDRVVAAQLAHVFGDVDLAAAKAASRAEREAAGLEHVSSLVYGEVDPSTFPNILRSVCPRPGGTFVDLGSGAGRPAIAAALTCDFGACIGIELLDGLARLSSVAADRYRMHRTGPHRREWVAAAASDIALLAAGEKVATAALHGSGGDEEEEDEEAPTPRWHGASLPPLPLAELSFLQGSFLPAAALAHARRQAGLDDDSNDEEEAGAGEGRDGDASLTTPPRHAAFDWWHTAEVVFANSTCFSDVMMAAIANLAGSYLPDGTRLVSYTRALAGHHPAVAGAWSWRVDQSWGKATVFVALLDRARGRCGPPLLPSHGGAPFLCTWWPAILQGLADEDGSASDWSDDEDDDESTEESVAPAAHGAVAQAPSSSGGWEALLPYLSPPSPRPVDLWSCPLPLPVRAAAPAPSNSSSQGPAAAPAASVSERPVLNLRSPVTGAAAHPRVRALQGISSVTRPDAGASSPTGASLLDRKAAAQVSARTGSGQLAGSGTLGSASDASLVDLPVLLPPPAEGDEDGGGGFPVSGPLSAPELEDAFAVGPAANSSAASAAPPSSSSPFGAALQKAKLRGRPSAIDAEAAATASASVASVAARSSAATAVRENASSPGDAALWRSHHAHLQQARAPAVGRLPPRMDVTSSPTGAALMAAKTHRSKPQAGASALPADDAQEPAATPAALDFLGGDDDEEGSGLVSLDIPDGAASPGLPPLMLALLSSGEGGEQGSGPSAGTGERSSSSPYDAALLKRLTQHHNHHQLDAPSSAAAPQPLPVAPPAAVDPVASSLARLHSRHRPRQSSPLSRSLPTPTSLPNAFSLATGGISDSAGAVAALPVPSPSPGSGATPIPQTGSVSLLVEAQAGAPSSSPAAEAGDTTPVAAPSTATLDDDNDDGASSDTSVQDITYARPAAVHAGDVVEGQVVMGPAVEEDEVIAGEGEASGDGSADGPGSGSCSSRGSVAPPPGSPPRTPRMSGMASPTGGLQASPGSSARSLHGSPRAALSEGATAFRRLSSVHSSPRREAEGGSPSAPAAAAAAAPLPGDDSDAYPPMLSGTLFGMLRRPSPPMASSQSQPSPSASPRSAPSPAADANTFGGKAGHRGVINDPPRTPDY